MARFLLRDKHYLNVPGTVWEEKEVDQVTGKQVRKDHSVGLYLDPNDPADWNYPHQKQIIVSTVRSNQWPADIIFVGPPTHDMEPLDDEAKELIGQLKTKGDPFSELPTTVGETVSERIIKLLESRLREATPPPEPQSDDRISALEAQLEEMKKLLTQAIGAKTNAPTDRLPLRRS